MNRLRTWRLLGLALVDAVAGTLVLAGTGQFAVRAADPIKIGLGNWATGFFEIAARQNPKPQTIALVGADAEYPRRVIAGARELTKTLGFKTIDVWA